MLESEIMKYLKEFFPGTSNHRRIPIVGGEVVKVDWDYAGRTLRIDLFKDIKGCIAYVKQGERVLAMSSVEKTFASCFKQLKERLQERLVTWS